MDLHKQQGAIIMEFKLKELVQQAAKEQGITGVMILCDHCKMPYRKVVKVWKGDKSVKLAHVEDVLNSLGYKLKAVPQND